MTLRSVPGYLALFASTTTLVCCALPALFVLAGFGAAAASVLSAAPWLVTLSRHKAWVFLAAAALLLFNGYYVYRLAPRLATQGPACSPEEAACAAANRFGRTVLWASVLVFAIGFFVAYPLGPILVWLAS